MLVKKQIKYFDVPLEHEWKVPVSQELLKARMNNLYFEGFDDYVITEMINMLCSSICLLRQKIISLVYQRSRTFDACNYHN